MSSVEDDDDGFRNTNVSECVRILRVKARDIMSPEPSFIEFDSIAELIIHRNGLF
jgi:hypothetical protein